MKKQILFLSLIFLIQAKPLCAMHRKCHRPSRHHASISRLTPSFVTLALLLALATPAEGYNCANVLDSRACYYAKKEEEANARRWQNPTSGPDFGRFGSPAYAQAVGWNYAERNRGDAEVRHVQDQIRHYQHLGHLQGGR